MVRQRHPPGAYKRETHLLTPIDYAKPSDSFYGSEMDLEAVTVVDLGQGSVTDGAIVDGGLDASEVIREGTIPAASLDTTPPPLPQAVTVTSEPLPTPDGGTVVGIVVSMVPPIDPESGENAWPADYFATHIYVTNENDSDPETPAPVWTRPITAIVGKGFDTAYITGVPGATDHWVQVQTVDVLGNYSPLMNCEPTGWPVTTVGDTEAPVVPRNVTGAGGYKLIGVRWEAASDADLMYNEVRYARELTPGVPDTEHWASMRTRGNSIIIDALVPGEYYAQVRSVDYSRNVATSLTDSTAVDVLDEGSAEAGWSSLVGPMTVTLVGGADIAAGSVIAGIVNANAIDAATIETGLLRVKTASNKYADGIVVLYGADDRVIGKWDEFGLDIYSKTADRRVLDYIHMDDASLVLYLNGKPTTAIRPDGIDATAVNFGTAEGGHNLVFNSSFELSKFISDQTVRIGLGGQTFAGGGNWATVPGGTANATLGATAITMATL